MELERRRQVPIRIDVSARLFDDKLKYTRSLMMVHRYELTSQWKHNAHAPLIFEFEFFQLERRRSPPVWPGEAHKDSFEVGPA